PPPGARTPVPATTRFRSTVENLSEAIGGENYEVEEMYPAFIAVAELQGEKGALRSMNFALEAEKIHAAMYGAARQSVQAGQDVKDRKSTRLNSSHVKISY